MFPDKIYYEEAAMGYELGKYLKQKYQDKTWIPIDSHNKIDELRTRPNSDFRELKQYLIIGIRKTHRHVPNAKVSDFLVRLHLIRLHCRLSVTVIWSATITNALICVSS